jgi:hypothetical protein
MQARAVPGIFTMLVMGTVVYLVPAYSQAQLQRTPQAVQPQPNQGDQHPWGAGRKWGNGANPPPARKGMTTTNALLQNDNLMPTMNRTYAMRLEAETGHTFPVVDNAVKPYVPQPKPRAVAPRRQAVRRPAATHTPQVVVKSYR